MKKKLLSIVLILLVFSLLIISYFINLEKEIEQEYIEPEWVTYHKEDRNGPTRGKSVFVYEKSIFVAMEAIGQASQGSRAILIKYDLNGTEIWKRTWGTDDLDDKAKEVFVYQGYIYVVGTTESYGDGSEDAFILNSLLHLQNAKIDI